jgi:Ca-activated chloride channel family protein
VNFPVLTDLKLDIPGVKTDLIYPRGIPDVFRGSQVMLIGRYSNEAELNAVRITLQGQSSGSMRSYTYDNLSFPLRSENNDYLPRLWATRRVGWLMEQVRANGEQKELRDEIVDLGTRYGIVTPYTSYLALESQNRQISSLNTLTPGTAPPPAKDANRGFIGGIGGIRNEPKAAPSAATQSVTVDSGLAAVQQSKRARGLSEADKLDDQTRKDAVRRVGEKTFYLIDGVWTDSEFKAEAHLPETALTFASDEYFALLKQESKLGSYFALGERVVVVFGGRVYRVNAATP